MTTNATPPKLQFLDANGAPLVGGKLYTYAAGTTTPQVSYTSFNGDTANTNPVILDSRGEASVWLGTALYKMALYSATDVLIWTVDNIGGFATLAQLAASGGSNLVGFLQAGTGAVATTVQAKLRESVSVKDFGAVGDGVADDTVAVQKAFDAFSTNFEIVFSAGFNFGVTKISINNKTNFSVRIDGKVTNIAAKAGATATDTNATQRGLQATFYIRNSSKFKIYGAGQINNHYREAFYVGCDAVTTASAPCTDFDISVNVIGDATNDNINSNFFKYCTNFTLHDMRLAYTGVKPPWVNIATIYYYNWVEAVCFFDCANFTINKVRSDYNPMNGFYFGSNCSYFTVTDNDMEHNAGSGLQITWSSYGAFPQHFNISNNRTRFNRADGFDIPNTGTLQDAFGTIIGNLSYYNGWGTENTAAVQYTNDGTSFTLLNLKKIIVADNIDINSSRKGVSCVACFDVIVTDNIITKTSAYVQAEGILTQECTNITVTGNNVVNLATLPAMKVFSTTVNTNIKILQNYFDGLVQFAGGTYVDCTFNDNKVITTTTLSMPVNCIGNTVLVSGAGQDGIYLGADRVVVRGNRVTAPNFGIVAFGLWHPTIEDNTATGVGGIRVDLCAFGRIRGNYASATSSPGIHILGVADNNELSMNEATSATGNSFRVESTCTNTQKWGNRAISGATSFLGTYGINF